jgi:hypothetical protein
MNCELIHKIINKTGFFEQEILSFLFISAVKLN